MCVKSGTAFIPLEPVFHQASWRALTCGEKNMKGREFLWYVPLPVLFLLLSLLAISYSPTMVQGATNTTYINAVLYIKTCTKQMLEEGSLLPHVVVKYNGSTIFNQECDTCRLYNISEGTYQVTVEWRGVIVYSGNIVLTAANSSAVDIITGTRRIGVSVLNDAGNPITYRVSVKISTPSGAVSFTPGETHILPFGDFGYEASYSWMCDIVVKRTGSFNVNCANSGLTVTLPVASEVTLKFEKADGSSVKGLNGSATIYAVVNGKKAATVDFREKDSISFANMPYGKYRVDIIVNGKKVLSKIFEVSSTSKRELVYIVPIMKGLKIKFLDADGEPISLLPVRIETPWGKEYKLGTDSNGEVYIGQAPLGTYTIEASWQGLTIKKVVDVANSEVTVSLPLRRVVAVITPKASVNLPKGLHLKVVMTRTGFVVKDTVLERDTPKWIVPLGLLLIDARYEASLSYLDNSWEYMFRAKNSTWEIKAPLYDVVVVVKTLAGELLSGCNLTISYDNIKYSFNIRSGSVDIRGLPETDVNAGVVCGGVTVYSGSFRPSRLTNGTYYITAYVTDIRLGVKGCCGRPLRDANVTLIISDGQKITLSSLSDDNGQVIFHNVPVPPGSSVQALIRYKNEEKRIVIDPHKSYETVTLDVFLDTPLGVLGMASTIALVIIIALVSVIAALIIRRYLYVKEVESLLVPELPVETGMEQGYETPYELAGYGVVRGEDFGEEGVLHKIKEFIKELLSGGREEEEAFFG